MQEKGQEEFLAGNRHRYRARHPVRRRRRHLRGTHQRAAWSRAAISIPQISRTWPFSTAASSKTYREKRHGFEGARQRLTAHGGTLAFLEPGLVAIGDTDTVKRAIDAQLTATSIIGNDEMMNLVRDIEAGNNAWAVGRFDVLTAHAKLPEQIARQIPPVKWFAAAGHINGGLSGMVRVEANDDEAAELFRRQVNGALAFGEMVGRSDPRASAVLKTVQMSGIGQNGRSSRSPSPASSCRWCCRKVRLSRSSLTEAEITRLDRRSRQRSKGRQRRLTALSISGCAVYLLRRRCASSWCSSTAR